MQKMLTRLVLFPTAAIHLLLASGLPVAQAASIGTSSFIEMRRADGTLAGIQDSLSRQDVRQQLLEMGVDADRVSARLAALTPGERDLLSRQLKELPAGAGFFEVIGIVFLVLLILELVGVTDIFKKL